MKIVLGVLMGAMSGFMIYFLAAMVAMPKDSGLVAIFVAITFLGGWAGSTYVLVKGARSVSKVFSRGFLLGAAEWLLLIPAGMILAGKTVSETIERNGGSDAAHAGAAIGGGLFAFLTGGVAVVMAIICLIGFAISYLIGREMKPEAPEANAATRKCPECAELVQAEARKCRFCGASLVASEEVPAATPSP